MKRKNLSTKVLLLGLLILFYACKNEISKPIPAKHPELSQGRYNEYLNLLKEAYRTNNHFDAAIQLANLKAAGGITYQLLDIGVKEASNNCDKVYNWYWLYDKHNFGVNILKLDTLRFKRTVNLCDELNLNSSYQAYAKLKDEEERQAIENKVVEDSVNFNMELVAALKQINYDDQEIRIRLNAKNMTPDLEKALRKEMHFVDSINLVKIDKIFKVYGYPSRELVGKDGNFTPALVIHHSNSLETRYKYLPFLEKAVEEGLLYEGTLNMIKRRIKDMEIDEK